VWLWVDDILSHDAAATNWTLEFLLNQIHVCRSCLHLLVKMYFARVIISIDVSCSLVGIKTEN
jgi:hypothetical protein